MIKKVGAFFAILIALGLGSSSVFAQPFSIGKVQATSLNVRKEASTTSTIISKLYNENEVLIISNVQDWYKIRLTDGNEGWISSAYAGIVKEGIDGYVNADSVNLRQEASTQSSVVAKLSKGAQLNVIEKTGDWYRVTYDGKTAYIYSIYANVPMLSTQTQQTAVVSRGEGRSGISNFALNLLGSKYVWGAMGPSTFDCSGFTRYVYKSAAGTELPHNSTAQSNLGTTVEKSSLAAGDLVFFTTDRSGNVNHTGIYAGNGKFVHASSAQGKVIVSDLNSGFYSETYKWAKRIGN